MANRDQYYLTRIRDNKNREAARREENKRIEELERHVTPLFWVVLIAVVLAVGFKLIDYYFNVA